MRPGVLRLVGDVRRLLDRQGVHVGAQPDRPCRSRRCRPLITPTTPVRPSPVTTSSHPKASELVRDDAGRAMHLVEELRVLVEVAAPGGDLVGEIGDAVDDGHGLGLPTSRAPLGRRRRPQDRAGPARSTGAMFHVKHCPASTRRSRSLRTREKSPDLRVGPCGRPRGHRRRPSRRRGGKGQRSSDHDEVGRGQRRAGVDGGEADLGRAADAVLVEEQRAGDRVVDDPVVAVGGRVAGGRRRSRARRGRGP